ncbi:hypothetical protein RR48_11494 [Papilio machaon]|uniref:Uncharacterized protein n=1 Tax=Papilio machaon TaxID=76193 RepID=A0A194R355_PAPMA|nr:hypothetical protein RR48_11494 [Papilio machaon]
MPKIFIRGASRLSRGNRARASDLRLYPKVGTATPPIPRPTDPAPAPPRRRSTNARSGNVYRFSDDCGVRAGAGVAVLLVSGVCRVSCVACRMSHVACRVGSFVIKCITFVES